MKALEILKHLISFKTITPKECGIYEWIKEYMGGDFVYEHFDCEGVKNLFAYRDFNPASKGRKFHLCFAGHVDVVPAEDWNSDAFYPEIRGNFLYGRGAQDMKGGIACFLSAIKQSQFETKDLILSFLLTSDEEGEAVYGTNFVLRELQKRDFLPDFALVAEPTSEQKIADTIKIGRRGSINGILEIKGVSGHVAYPKQCLNPVELLGSKLGQIAGVLLDEGDEFFQPSKIVVTDVRGGIGVCNVTPSSLRLMFNVRNSTMSNEDGLRTYLDSILQDLPFELSLKVTSRPFLTQSGLLDFLAQSVFAIQGYFPKTSTSGGTSDARYFASFGVGVLELGLRNDTIHAKDECVSIQDLEVLERIFLDFLSRF